MVSKRNYESLPTSNLKKRLPAFQAIAQDEPQISQESTRNIFVSGIDPWIVLSDIQRIFEKFGDLHVFDTHHLAFSEVIVSYYDIRDARHAFVSLSQIYFVKYLPDPLEVEYIDFVVLSDPLDNNPNLIFKALGQESMQIMRIDSYWIVKYYDRRRVWLVQSSLLHEDVKIKYEKIWPSDLKFEEKGHPDPCDTNPIEKEPLALIDLNANMNSIGPQIIPKRHSVVPKKKIEGEDKGNYVISLELVLSNVDRRTTIMIKNIPNKYTQAMLIQSIDLRHAGSYDFLYLPIDFKNKCNVGYSFINFIDHRFIPAFYQEFDGKTWERFNSNKICALSYARIQGRAALEKHFQSSSIMVQNDTSMKPLILS
ncbi:unnamed protein product [Blepharisma stoltei]|uniref:Mei2-like C-terminal RNA recognition motif domain-containing protein n=1 Tax=Blepharisma stoltei TaxID=1481888 RepID=A0AAU9JAY2_9CILI|nr:unnamed protein product [Blepharisma stoltei]